MRCLVRDVRRAEKLPELGLRARRGRRHRSAEPARAPSTGVDTVVHLVAIRQGKPEQFQRIMVEGTRDLLGAAKEAASGGSCT